MRRLLLAQMAVLTLLWVLALTLVLWEAHKGNGVLDSEPIYESVLTVAQDLVDHPERLQHSLRAMDRAIRAGYGTDADDTAFSPTLLLWHGDHLLYRSPDGAPVMHNSQIGEAEYLHVDGLSWLARTVASEDGELLLTMVIPGFQQMALTVNSRGYFIVPLVISLPFLILPAWWSVRVALRPWAKLSADIAARGPRDLQPLRGAPRHQELRPLVQALNRLLARLRAGTQRERNLIADAAHELRTPLAAMRINVEALREQSGQRELMDNLLRSNERATRLVGQLLRLMRSDAAQDGTPMAALALDSLLQDRLARLEGLARSNGVELELDCTPGLSVQGELESLESLIDNLVDNAIKYSPAGSIVSVVLSRVGRFARLEVWDEGPGIEAAWRDRVFDRFFRVPDQNKSGSGLGLAIVKSVALKHRGRIELAEGRRGPGLCVRVHLPLVAA